MADGHRGRVRDRFKEENIDTIPEYQVLERIIHNVVVRRDAGEVSRELIRMFGSLAQVIDAPEHELRKVKGVGPAVATYLKLIPSIYRKYRLSKWIEHRAFRNPEEIIAYMHDKLIGYQTEAFAVLCLDANFKFLACKTIFEGTTTAVDVNIRKLLDFAIASNAVRAVIAHNHLNNDPNPSNDDLETTKKVYNALHYANIHLDDHIIVTEDDSVSLARIGKMPSSVSDKDK